MLPRNKVDPLFNLKNDLVALLLETGPRWINVWSHQRDPSWIRAGAPHLSREDATSGALGRLSYRVKVTAKSREVV